MDLIDLISLDFWRLWWYDWNGGIKRRAMEDHREK